MSANHILLNFLSAENVPEWKWAFRAFVRNVEVLLVLSLVVSLSNLSCLAIYTGTDRSRFYHHESKRLQRFVHIIETRGSHIEIISSVIHSQI